MFIRQRGVNLSLERPVYIPAVKAEDGKTTLTPARRTTKYLGSVKAWHTPDRIPAELAAKLTETELSELTAHLQQNVVPPVNWLARLPEIMLIAARDLGVKAEAVRAQGQDPRRSYLAEQLNAIAMAGGQLLAAAQAAGVRRKGTRKPKAPARPKKARR
jgi:hypothetical protein